MRAGHPCWHPPARICGWALVHPRSPSMAVPIRHSLIPTPPSTTNHTCSNRSIPHPTIGRSPRRIHHRQPCRQQDNSRTATIARCPPTIAAHQAWPTPRWAAPSCPRRTTHASRHPLMATMHPMLPSGRTLFRCCRRSRPGTLSCCGRRWQRRSSQRRGRLCRQGPQMF